MDRIEAIKAYKIRKDKAEVKEREELALKIRGLGDRIEKLIETANACIENDIEINAKEHKGPSFDTWEDGTFCTSSSSRKIGFACTYQNNRFIGKIVEMGIDGGEDDMSYLRTNGKMVRDIYSQPPCIYQMRKFVNTFDDFETAFYAYIDKIIGE